MSKKQYNYHCIIILHLVSPGQLNIPTEEFFSKKITNKLVQQIQDPLVIASGAAPSWCQSLTMACPMLFPFDVRQLHFACTAFGASRFVKVFSLNEKFVQWI